MKRVFILGCAAAAGMAGNAAFATDDAGAFYISPMVQYHLLDQERVSNDNFGAQFGLGFNMLHGFALEADVNRANFSISGLTADQRLTGYSVDIIKKFLPDSLFRPYLLAGAGEMDDTLTKSPRTFHTSLAEAGIGVLTGLGSQTGSTRVQLRTEAKYRLEFANPGIYGPKDPSDVVFGVGVQMMFGAPEPPPPPPRIVEVQAPNPAAAAPAAAARSGRYRRGWRAGLHRSVPGYTEGHGRRCGGLSHQR